MLGGKIFPFLVVGIQIIAERTIEKKSAGGGGGDDKVSNCDNNISTSRLQGWFCSF